MLLTLSLVRALIRAQIRTQAISVLPPSVWRKVAMFCPLTLWHRTETFSSRFVTFFGTPGLLSLLIVS